ncbi:MAG: TlpA disulfide reductase family protein [Bacteroidota bacterium]
MKKLTLILFLITSFLILNSPCIAQTKQRKIPSVKVKTLDGKTFDTGTLSNKGNPMIISFWATWCKPCIRELTNIADVYEDWQEETGVKLIAVSIDNTRSTAKVGPFVNGKGWDYEFYLDPNGDFKRALGVNMIPHTFLVNGKNEIVWQRTTYTEGEEEELFELIKKTAAGEMVK